MSRKKIFLPIAVIIFILSVWKFDDFMVWKFNKKWEHIPEFIVQPELIAFHRNCSPSAPIFGFARISQVDDELPDNLSEEFSYVTNAIIESYSEFNFSLTESKPYFFKCRHDQYLLVWHMENYETNREAYVTAQIDSKNIWRLGGVTSTEKRTAEQ